MEAGVDSTKVSQKSSTAFVTPSLSALHSLIDIELMKRSSRHDILRLAVQEDGSAITPQSANTWSTPTP